MKVYLHIVNNRPFTYAFGKDSEEKKDTAEFVRDASIHARDTFTENTFSGCDWNGTLGSVIHVLTITPDSIKRHSD